MPSPLGEGEISVLLFRFGLQDELGILAAASERSDFPVDTEALLLRVAGNQAAIALQEARRFDDQKRTAAELEGRVVERSEQLTLAVEELKGESSERARAEEETRKLALLVENSTDFIGIATLAGEVLYLNRAGQDMVGLDGDEQAWASRMRDYVADEDWQSFEQQILPTVIREGRWDGEARLRHFKTGAMIPTLQHIFFINNPSSDQRIALATIIRDITERKQAEGEMLALKDELAAELAAMTRLHQLSMRLQMTSELQPILEEVLDATIALLGADFGNVQLYDTESHALKIVAQRGFQQEFLDHFNSVEEGTASCGVALQRRERVIVEDVLGDPSFAPHLKVVAAAGYRAVQSTPLISRDGELLGMMSTHFRRPHRPPENELRLADLYARQASDMIARKRAEEVLRQSEERFRLMVEGVKDYAIYLLDREGRVTSWNAGAERLKGYRAEEILGQHSSWFYSPEEIANGKPAEQLMLARANGRSEDEGWRVRKDGTRFWASVLTTALRSEDGTLIGFSKLTRDITERQRTEEWLRRAQEQVHRQFAQLQAIYRTAPVGLCFLSPRLLILNINTRLAEMIGLTSVTGIGRSLGEALPALGDTLEPLCREAIASGDPVLDIELDAIPATSPGGRERIWTVSLFPVKHQNRTVIGLNVVVQDFTERRQTEAALYEMREELTRVSRVVTIGELAASIAHEVNQPLAGVVTNANAGVRWLSGAEPNLVEVSEALARIIRDGRRASDVIARIRMLVKKTGTVKELLDLKGAIQETLTLVQGEVRRRAVDMRTELPGALPVVFADRVQLQQVMINLIVNGIEAMSEPSDRPRELLIAAAQEQTDKVRVSVRDTGVGIESAMLERVFESFYTTKPQGLGIGLSISRSIIEAHGGRLWATPNDGLGTTFQFTLPIYRASGV
jgi:PAS domain S-box-containing protein